MSDPGAHIGLSRRERRQLLEGLRASQPQPQPRPQPLLVTPPAPATSDSPTILFVCTGNICRSPMGEVLLRARLSDLDVRVHSAGTHALVDHGMTEQAQQLAVGLGAQAELAAAHSAQLLVQPLLRDADLILTMAREHRTHSVQLMPDVLKRVFTVREFARLASSLSTEDALAAAVAAGTSPRDRLRAVVTGVSRQRGMTAANPEEDDIIDPYRRSQKTYELSASQLAPAIDETERVIRLALGAHSTKI